MAAAEYYFGTDAAQNLNRPNPYEQQLQQPPQSNAQLQPYNAPSPSYAPYAPPHQYQRQLDSQPQGRPLPLPQHQQWPSNGRPPLPASQSQYPPTARSGYPSQPYQQNGFLGAPLMPQRSHSQPPRVQFADHDEYDDASDRSFCSDSDSSPRRRHKHRSHSHSRGHSHSHAHSHSHSHAHHSSYGSDSESNSDSHDRHRDRSTRIHNTERKDRSTFLGAGAGGLIGDTLLPGLGAAAGALFGGYGGRHRAKKRSGSEADKDKMDRGGREFSSRHKGGKGWDEESATYKSGWAVR